MNIWNKVQLVFGKGTDDEEKMKELRKYDLWGPFLFTLIYSL